MLKGKNIICYSLCILTGILAGCQSQSSGGTKSESNSDIYKIESISEKPNATNEFTDIDYTFDESTKTLTVNGSGRMNWDKGSFDYKDLCKTVEPKKLVISSGITFIQDYAFICLNERGAEKKVDHFDQIESIVLPDSLTEIGNGSFENCSGLKKLSIPNGVEKIGDSTFCFCDNLSEIKLPDSLKSIGNFAFANCYKLKTVSIPKSVDVIGEKAFGINTEDNSVTKDFTIYGYKNSVAEKYANENGFSFIAME